MDKEKALKNQGSKLREVILNGGGIIGKISNINIEIGVKEIMKMMKKRRFAGFTAAMLSAATMFSTVGMVQGGEVTEKENISIHFENEVGKKVIADEDMAVLAEYMGYDWVDGAVMICDKDTKAWIDWEQSAVSIKDVFESWVYSLQLSRDENGQLLVESCTYRGVLDWYIDETGMPQTEGLGGYPYFHIGGEEQWDKCDVNHQMGNVTNMIKEHFGEECFDDVYFVRICYNYNAETDRYSFSDTYFLPEDVSTVLNLEDDVEETPTDAPSDKHEVDISQTPVVSKETFASLLEENKTKDVVIKTNNGVTFTFEKGKMQEVDGKDSYDFTTTIHNTYQETLPSYVSKDKFIAKIDFNYSGKLPAEAKIRFFVGTQYAGQNLYYSLMNENQTFAEVQKVVVDAEGYVTVKQDHCSSYVLTKEEPKLKNEEESSTPEETTKEESTEETTTSKEVGTEETTAAGKNDNTNKAPGTADNAAIMPYILVCMAGAALMTTICKSKKVESK